MLWRRCVRPGSAGAIAALALLAASLETGCNHRPLKTGRRASATPSADRQPLSTAAVVAPGIVEPWEGEVRVAAKEAGWVAGILVREGQAVRTGDLLALLDEGQQAAGAEVARAEVAELEAVLERALQGATAEELAQVRAERDAAAARAARARSDAGRVSLLMADGLVARADGERALKDAEAETAGAAALQARYQAIVRGSRVEDIAAARRRLEAARARLRGAEAAVARRAVTSPLDGTVLWSRYRPGEFYTAGSQALFILGDVSRYQIRVDVDEIDAPRVAVGSQVAIRVEGSAKVGQGQVVSTSPKMGRKNLLVESPTTRNDVRIREVLVEAPADGRLLPGLRVWVQIEAPPAS